MSFLTGFVAVVHCLATGATERAGIGKIFAAVHAKDFCRFEHFRQREQPINIAVFSHPHTLIAEEKRKEEREERREKQEP